MSEILHFSKYRFLILSVLIYFASSSTSAQTTISGKVIDAGNKEMLPYVNIGIKHKNIGTVSAKNGSYSILIPTQNQDDTLTFSMVGYNEFNLPLRNIISTDPQTIKLEARHLALEPARVTVKLVEKKIGLVKNHALIHFVDGSTNKNDIFEIAQLVKLDTILTKITSVNLTITEAREDSGLFRINFYGFDGLRPTGRVVETSLIQTHAIVPGLLLFDLKKYNIYLKGNIVIGIEFLPTGKANSGRINYEVKLGGPAKSFVRTSSQGDWRVPPHHYRLFITALTRADAKTPPTEEDEDKETHPSVRLFSLNVQDSFSVFVRLPKDYARHKHQKYPVVFLLDANAYFDNVSNVMSEISKNYSAPEPILIGIGYKDFIQDDSLRNRDFTYPKALVSDSFSVSGGADKFLGFIEKELIPFVDRTYRTDTTSRTIMGHSLGGYFTLYALERELVERNNRFRHF
ncbi:MAG TPA: alpha/beta hydrolase-fold protein, partial [Puia sp.]|nr:alpha/beta hydrolase-fold protein [Puia sp.]